MGRHRPLVSVVLALGTGVVLADALRWERPGALPWLGGLVGLVLVAWWVRTRDGRRGGLFSAVLLLGVVGLGATRLAQVRLPIEALWASAPRVAFLRGVIVNYPWQDEAHTRFTLKPDGLPGRVEVFYSHPHHRPVALHYGDRLWLQGPPQAPQPFAGFDYPAYLARRGIWAVLYLHSPDQVERLSGGHGWAPLRWGERWRDALFARLERDVPPPQAAGLQALLLGERAALEPALEENFRDAGVAHVLAVSGLHLGILVGALWLALRGLGLRAGWTYVLVSALVLVYLLLVGFRVSLVRAALLFGFVALGSVLKERGVILSAQIDPLQGWAAAGALILLQNPSALFEVSFQLSFAATGMILAALPLLEALLTRWELRPRALRPRLERWRRGAARWALSSTFISLAAQLGVLPFIALHFQRLYLGTVLSNLLVVPLVTLILWLGLVWLALLPLAPLSALLGRLLGLGLAALAGLVGALAGLPGMVQAVAPWPGWAIALYFVVLLAGGRAGVRRLQASNRALAWAQASVKS